MMGSLLFPTGSTQPPIQWISKVLPPGIKRPRPEADNSPPSSVEVKNTWSYTSTPQYSPPPASYPMGTRGFPWGKAAGT
jgi:hypothetical protein